MVSCLKKFKVLIWKCLILRKRNWLLTASEFIFPLLVIGTIYLMNKVITSEGVKPQGKDDILYVPPVNYRETYIYNDLNMMLAYTPNTSDTFNIMQNFQNKSKNVVKALNGETELESWLNAKRIYSDSELQNCTPVGIVFLKVDTKHNKYKYKVRVYIRANATGSIKPEFSELQFHLDYKLLTIAGVQFDNSTIFTGALPLNTNAISIGPEAPMMFMMFLLTFTYICLVVVVMRDCIQEKASGIKELMKIMGVSSWMIWTHWFVYSMIVQFPLTFIIAFVLTSISPVVIPAPYFIVWILFLLFTIDCIVMLFAISCFFTRPTIGSLICITAWTVSALSCMNLTLSEIYKQVLVSLIPIVNLAFSLRSIVLLHDQNEVVWNFSMFFDKDYDGSPLSIGIRLIIFLLETMVFTIMLIYLDGIMPGPYGIAKPLTFFKLNWFREPNKKEDSSDSNSSSSAESIFPNTFEPPPKGTTVGVEIRGLRKTFGVINKKVAVENINLDIYEGEIMALLGHNGAGKTTTMSIITGMFSPTKGTVVANGMNVYNHLNQFRKTLGLCPQHNLYFPKLNVLEHLIFFGMLKGNSHFASKENGLKLLQLLNISEKRNEKGSKLSGGMLRRLCLAVALTGDPKLLILDEPSSGLDPENRRLVWNVLLSFRGERTILVSTHFMEEAEVLGDRIAVISHGKVVCCGTSMFLKKMYGTGYHINILKNPKSNRKNIDELVYAIAPDFVVKDISPSEVDYLIKENYVNKFPEFFSNLERSQRDLGIINVSVSCSSLEDVFLRVAEIDKQENNENDSTNVLTSPESSSTQVTSGCDLYFQRFQALLLKRFYHLCRNWKSLLFKIVVTSLLVFQLIYLESGFGDKQTKTQSESVDLSIYSKPEIPIAYDKNNEGIARTTLTIISNKNGIVDIRNVSTDEKIVEYLKTLLRKKSNYYGKHVLCSLSFFNNTITIRHQMYNFKKGYTSEVAANLLANIFLQQKHPQGSIEVASQPYIDKCSLNNINYYKSNISTSWATFFILILMYFMAEYLNFIIEDKESGFKHQQVIAGVSPCLYWAANFLFDYCIYIIALIIWLSIILIFGKDIVEWNSLPMGLLTLALFIFGANCIVFVYFYSTGFKSATFSIGIFFAFNLLWFILYIILYLTVKKDYEMYIHILLLLLINPVFAVIICIFNIASVIADFVLCRECGHCPVNTNELLKMPTDSNRRGILLYLLFLAFSWIIFALLLLLIEYIYLIAKLFTKKMAFDKTIQDEDVINEYERVKQMTEDETEDYPLVVDELVKVYRSTKVVNHVTFLISPGECFGLLGVNGAGKTTTFKMLTGEILPSSGDAFANYYSVLKQRSKYLLQIGYCPQFDAFLKDLTGEETLKIFAYLRGIPRKEVKQEVSYWLEMMGITEHSRKRAVTYSGGTKRKLSTAMAFMGNPSVVYLDEPTTGVDPVSRRKLWSVVQTRQSLGQSIVLTSHSMDECEALCTRLTIMRSGQMQCIGSLQHLKTKFVQGYIVFIKLADHDNKQLKSFKKDFLNVFPKSVVKDNTVTMITFQVLDQNITLSQIFSQMLSLKSKCAIVENFYVSNANLEQLFLSIARGEDIQKNISKTSISKSKLSKS